MPDDFEEDWSFEPNLEPPPPIDSDHSNGEDPDYVPVVRGPKTPGVNILPFLWIRKK